MKLLGGVPVIVWSFIALIAVSRLGLFMFDLVVTQIVQMVGNSMLKQHITGQTEQSI